MAKEKRKKSVFKRVLLLFTVAVALIVIGIVGAAIADTSSGGSSKVTLAEFNKVKNGMSYAEVKSIVGGEGTVSSESGKEGDSDYTVIYDYKGSGDLGANVSFMFQGGKLINKSQAGLN